VDCAGGILLEIQLVLLPLKTARIGPFDGEDFGAYTLRWLSFAIHLYNPCCRYAGAGSFIGSLIGSFGKPVFAVTQRVFPRVFFQRQSQRRIFSAAAFKKKRSGFGLCI
jgi:hypothetical protein